MGEWELVSQVSGAVLAKEYIKLFPDIQGNIKWHFVLVFFDYKRNLMTYGGEC